MAQSTCAGLSLTLQFFSSPVSVQGASDVCARRGWPSHLLQILLVQASEIPVVIPIGQTDPCVLKEYW